MAQLYFPFTVLWEQLLPGVGVGVGMYPTGSLIAQQNRKTHKTTILTPNQQWGTASIKDQHRSTYNSFYVNLSRALSLRSLASRYGWGGSFGRV